MGRDRVGVLAFEGEDVVGDGVVDLESVLTLILEDRDETPIAKARILSLTLWPQPCARWLKDIRGMFI